MDIICYLPDAIGAKHKKRGFHDKNKEKVGGIGSYRWWESIRTNMLKFIFGTLQLFHSNISSYPSRGSGHGLGLQKCEARAIGLRKPCGGFIELGLTGLGLGWPAASRPGRHITNSG